MPVLVMGLAILGYTILYTGAVKLGGDAGYRLGDALMGTTPKASTTKASSDTTSGNGTTVVASRQQSQQQQQTTVPTSPVSVA